MDSFILDCEHINKIIDHHTADEICANCGLVLDRYYSSIEPMRQPSTVSHAECISNILDKLHLPLHYTHLIEKNLRKNEKSNTLASICFSIYKTLNEIGINISINDISAVSGVTRSKIYKEQKTGENVTLNYNNLCEKYCDMLNLDFRTTTLIKEKIEGSMNSGHTPNTIIASKIYKVCKNQKIKISIQQVANVVKVSPISIKRYIKNDNSSW